MSTVFSARGIIALVFVCVTGTQALAQQPGPTILPKDPDAQGKEHVVRKGDTLWDLARYYLSDPFRWPLIYDANRKVVENPHWIYPQERLVIPGMPAETLKYAVSTAGPPSRSIFYTGQAADSGTATLVTSESLVIPLVQPKEWLAAPWVADSAGLNIVAKVFKTYDPRDQKDKLSQTFHPRDRLYVSTLGSAMKPGDQLLAVRLTRNLRGYGWVIEPQAVLRIDSVAPTTALAMVINQFADLRVGDVAIPLPEIPPMPADRLTDVTGGPVSHIVDFQTPQPLYSTTEYAFVALGSAQGLAIGDELVAFVPRQSVSEKRPQALPDQTVAQLRVIRVGPQTSTVRVTRMNNASLASGQQVRVARKAP